MTVRPTFEKIEIIPTERYSTFHPNIHYTSIIASRFHLKQKIGEGTFAELWRAEDTKAAGGSASVALKIFRPSAEGDPNCAWEPVFKEVAAGLRMAPHPNVLRAWALLRVRFFEGQETPCLVMEYVDGLNLALWLEQLNSSIATSLEPRLAVMSDVLTGMAHAHASEIIHRDINFGNVLVWNSQPTKAVLTDFGCSQIGENASLDEKEEEPSCFLQPINPPPYFGAVSQASGAHRDVYAFATLCYLALTGRHPLSDDWQSMRTNKWTGAAFPHRTLPRRRMTELAHWIREDLRLSELSDLLLRCVAADPATRPESGIVLKAEWSRIME